MIRLIYAAPSPEERDALRDAVNSDTEINLVSVARDGQEAVQMTVEHRPDVVVLTDDLRGLDGFEAAGLINAVSPATKLLLVVEDDSRDAMSRAMWRGVRCILPRPVATPAILQAVVRAAQLEQVRERPEYQNSIDPERFPRIVAVTGAKGGIGKTSLATNLAVVLAMSNRGPTCLVDTYTQFGDVATALGLNPTRTLIDLYEGREPPDLDLLRTVTVTHPSGLEVLVGSSTPQPLDALPGEFLEQVLWTLRQHYRFIVVDVPNLLNDPTIRVLETVHTTLLVCNLMDLSTVTDSRRWLEVIRDAHVPGDRLKLVLNRVGRESPLPAEEVENSLGLKAWATVPNDSMLVSQSMNEGVPFVISSPNHPVSQAVCRMAEAVMATNAPRAMVAGEEPRQSFWQSLWPGRKSRQGEARTEGGGAERTRPAMRRRVA